MTTRPVLLAEVHLHAVQPLTFSHHGTTGLPMLTRGVDADGRHLRTVYIPAAQFRGRIRHEAALAELRARPGKVKLEEAYMLALGQDLRPEEEDEPEAIRLREQLEFRAKNPLLDLFGTWKVASRLFVSHFLPPVNLEPDTIAHIRRDLDTNEDVMALLDGAEQDRLFDRQASQRLASQAEGLIKMARRELALARKAKDEARIAELGSKLEELEALKKSHKGDDESSNTKHLLELQVIPAGVDLNGRFTVHGAMARDLKTLVDAFDGFSRKPYLGAQRARGCGEVRGTARFVNGDGEVLAVVGFGALQPARIEWTEAGRAFATAAAEVAPA